MIDSVKQIVTMRAVDLPPTFDVRVGNVDYPFEIQDMDNYYVYMIDTTNNEVVYIPRTEYITVLIPDTLENAQVDIEFALMQLGMFPSIETE